MCGGIANRPQWANKKTQTNQTTRERERALRERERERCFSVSGFRQHTQATQSAALCLLLHAVEMEQNEDREVEGPTAQAHAPSSPSSPSSFQALLPSEPRQDPSARSSPPDLDGRHLASLFIAPASLPRFAWKKSVRFPFSPSPSPFIALFVPMQSNKPHFDVKPSLFPCFFPAPVLPRLPPPVLQVLQLMHYAFLGVATAKDGKLFLFARAYSCVYVCMCVMF